MTRMGIFGVELGDVVEPEGIPEKVIGKCERWVLTMRRELTPNGSPKEISAVTRWNPEYEKRPVAFTTYNEKTCPKGYSFHDKNLQRAGI